MDATWTYTLTNGILILDGNSGLRTFSLTLISGAATITGNMTITLTLNGDATELPSEAVSMITLTPVAITNNNAQSSFTIDASAGSVLIIAQR